MTDRAARKTRTGTVISDARDKTVTVEVITKTRHPRYDKVVRHASRFHVHAESNDAKVGDLVLITETRPLSKTKRWRLAEIVERAR